jgi:valacyclovir hydrolase
MPTVKVEGQTIYYIVVGKGPHTVVLLPGFLGTVDLDFAKLFPLLNETDFRWICWDPPGYGRSRPNDAVHDADFYIRSSHFLENFMQELGHEKFSIVGWSQGGSTGMLLADRSPEEVIKCIFWGCFAYFTPLLLRAFDLFTKLDLWPVEKLEEKLQFFEKEYLRKMSTDMLKTAIEVVSNKEGKFLGPSLPKVQCPTLILHGAKERMTDGSQPVKLCSAFKNASIHYFPEGGHDLHLQFPSEFVKVVEAFLSKEE